MHKERLERNYKKKINKTIFLLHKSKFKTNFKESF